MWTSRVRVPILIALLGVLAGTSWVHAQGKAKPTLTGADVAEIERLYARYSQGLDFQDEELFLSAYADDAVLTSSSNVVWKGKEELRRRFRETQGGEGKTTLHNNLSILITPTEEGAKGRGYWVLLDVSQREPKVMLSGHYFDTFVRTPEGWRIKTRGSVMGWDWRVKK